MKPRDIVLAQIHHHETTPVPYTLWFEGDVAERLDAHYGSKAWRNRLRPFLKGTGVVSTMKREATDRAGVERDPDAIEIGLDVLESVQPEARGMNPYELKKAWGDRIAFWGCLGSQSTIPFGTPAQIKAEVRRLRREMGKGGGFILAPAKSLQPGTPTANAAAVVEAFTGDQK